MKEPESYKNYSLYENEIEYFDENENAYKIKYGNGKVELYKAVAEDGGTISEELFKLIVTKEDVTLRKDLLENVEQIHKTLLEIDEFSINLSNIYDIS